MGEIRNHFLDRALNRGLGGRFGPSFSVVINSNGGPPLPAAFFLATKRPGRLALVNLP